MPKIEEEDDADKDSGLYERAPAGGYFSNIENAPEELKRWARIFLKHRNYESMYTAKTAMLCYNPGTDQVKLIPFPDTENVSSGYSMSSLACWDHVRGLTFEQRKALIFIEAVQLIVRDKCDPLAVHRALLGLLEYVDGCAEDLLEIR